MENDENTKTGSSSKVSESSHPLLPRITNDEIDLERDSHRWSQLKLSAPELKTVSNKSSKTT